jgi:hypothetical protein
LIWLHAWTTIDIRKDETILLKIPVAVPYQIDSEGYERVDGEFEHQGEFYRLVKQKYQNDTFVYGLY